MNYPSLRPRRLRRLKALRDMVAETTLTPQDFMMPVFVVEDAREPSPIPSMPGYYRYPVDMVVDAVSKAVDLGVKSVIVFGIPAWKDEKGSSAYSEKGVVQRAVRLLKEAYGQRLIVATDVCMCQYTSHGHCGIVRVGDKCAPGEEGCWTVDNDETIEILGRIAVSHAEAGADMVAPSSMMDGMVQAIRRALDEAGFKDVAIMSYAVKYASSFYGPFRDAAHSAPSFGDRRAYQMDPRNAMEALKEAGLDVEEGADILMVKPALAYLDVIRLVKDAYPHYPLAAYSVSGEYSMIKAAAGRGWLDEKRVVLEILTAIKRAGADLIITYYAADAALWLREDTPF